MWGSCQAELGLSIPGAIAAGLFLLAVRRGA